MGYVSAFSCSSPFVVELSISLFSIESYLSCIDYNKDCLQSMITLLLSLLLIIQLINLRFM